MTSITQLQWLILSANPKKSHCTLLLFNNTPSQTPRDASSILTNFIIIIMIKIIIMIIVIFFIIILIQSQWQYTPSDTLRRQNTRRERVEESGMSGEKVIWRKL